jgi:hypothetical protein
MDIAATAFSSAATGIGRALGGHTEWAVQRGRYMSLETIAPLSDGPIIKLPAVAAA